VFTSQKIAVYAAAILVLAASYILRLRFADKPQVLPKNQKLAFLATIDKQPRISERFQIITVGDSKLFTDFFPRYHVGDRLKVSGKVSDDGLIFNAKVEKVGDRRSLSRVFASLRTKLAANMASLLPGREATLVLGTVLGVDEIAGEFRDQLIRTGTIHVVVVSGQNLSIVAGLFLAQAKIFGRRKSLILAILAVFFYAILTGFEPPVVRASLMVLAASLAVFLGRQSWPIWNLILAAMVIIFIWPKALFEVSFQLTFAATLGIMTLGQKIQLSVFGYQLSDLGLSVSRLIGFMTGKPKTGKLTSENRQQRTDNRLIRLMANALFANAAVAVSAYLFTLPIILFYFGRVSILAPVANILIAPVITPVMILGFLIAGTSLLFKPLAQMLAYFAYVPSFYFVKVIEIISRLA